MTTELTRTRLSTAEFNHLVDSGALGEEARRAYLWDGEILTKMVPNQPHAMTCQRLRRLLDTRLDPADWSVLAECPVELADGFKLVPDLMVVRGTLERYDEQAPRAEDVGLLVAVSDTTYSTDRGQHLEQFARDGIVQYWIVNIPKRRVEVYRDPDRVAGDYRQHQFYEIGTGVPVVLTLSDDTTFAPEIAVAGIFPPERRRVGP